MHEKNRLGTLMPQINLLHTVLTHDCKQLVHVHVHVHVHVAHGFRHCCKWSGDIIYQNMRTSSVQMCVPGHHQASAAPAPPKPGA